MEFRILGPLEVCGETGPLPLGGAKQRGLLAVLILHANEVVSIERLLEDLWGERQPASGAKALHVYVSQLRKLLGEGRILTQPPGYVLRVDPDELDAALFEQLREQAEGAQPQRASAILRDAFALWRGAPLADVAYESFAQSEIARLEELHTAALEQRIDADLDLGRHAEVVGELEAVVHEHPLRERLQAQLMLALYRSGRQAEALAAYQDARRVLVDELGIEPSKALSDLHQAILRHDAVLDLPVAERAADSSRGAFVGRRAELHELLAGLNDAFAGRGRLFLLAGEPGIGKSRLAEELAAHAAARRAHVLVGRCWEAGGAPAFWPWIEALRSYMRENDAAALRDHLGAGAAELAQITPDLRRLFPELPSPSGLESEGARFRLFDAVAEFLKRASADRPIVLVLDDLHAADAPSLLLLRFLARGLGSSRVLILGAYRDVDPVPGASLTAMLTDVAREPVTQRLPLRGLSGHDIEEFVELTASELASRELTAALHERTEGNPLFVAEAVRLLVSEGRQSESEGASRIAIPQSIRDVVTRRLTHLSIECNRTLVLASVLGREFALATLARFSGAPEDDLFESLDEAMAARIVSEIPDAPGLLRFAHVLIRDTLYEGLTAVRRVQLHRRAARVLEALFADEEGPHLAELALHAIAGRDFAQGLRHARRAADRALALLAYEEAARLYETALDALEFAGPADETTRCELLLSLGEAESRAGSSAAAKTAFLAAAEVARELGLSRELARAAAGYGGRLFFGRADRDDQVVPLLEEGLAVLGEQDLELRARLLARLAGALRDDHQRDRRDALSREALDLVGSIDNPEALADALNGRVAAILAPDTLVECLALGTELRDLAAQIDDKERAGHGHILRIHALVQLGEIAAAERDLSAALSIARDLREPVRLWEAVGVQAMFALAAGRLTEAEEISTRAHSLGEHAQPGMAIPVFHLQRYMLCEFRGRLDEVEGAIDELVAEYPARPVFRCARAYLHARLGRFPEAKRALHELAGNDCSVLPFDTEWLYAVSLLAETCGILEETGPAADLYRLLLPWAALNVADVGEGVRGSVSRYLGILAATTRSWSDAERHFEDAVEANARMRLLPWAARTREDYARMLLTRGEAGDPERGKQLYDVALAAYKEIGVEPSGGLVVSSV